MPLVIWQEAGYWRQLETSAVRPRAVVQFVNLQDSKPTIVEEPVKVNFDCLGLWYHMPLQGRIIKIFEFPAAAISG